MIAVNLRTLKLANYNKTNRCISLPLTREKKPSFTTDKNILRWSATEAGEQRGLKKASTHRHIRTRAARIVVAVEFPRFNATTFVIEPSAHYIRRTFLTLHIAV